MTAVQEMATSSAAPSTARCRDAGHAEIGSALVTVVRQQRAECRADDRAAAAEDRHAADHHSGDTANSRPVPTER